METSVEGRGAQEDFAAFAVRKGALGLLDTPSYYVTSIPFEKRHREVEPVPDPTATVVHQLTDSLFETVVLPAIAAQTRAEFFRALRARWGEYRRTMTALGVLFETTPTGAAMLAAARAEGSTLVSEAESIGGRAAGEEALFAEETYQSAARIVKRFAGLPPATDDTEDLRLAEKFNGGSDIYTFGRLMICAIATGQSGTSLGIEMAFELMRAGALATYSAAREALDLRQEPDDFSSDPLPFDEEDKALALADG